MGAGANTQCQSRIVDNRYQTVDTLDPTLDHPAFTTPPWPSVFFCHCLVPRVARRQNERARRYPSLDSISLCFLFFQDIVQLQRDLHNCERLFVPVSWPQRTRTGTSARSSDRDSYANGGLHWRATARNCRLPLTGPHIQPPNSLQPSSSFSLTVCLSFPRRFCLLPLDVPLSCTVAVFFKFLIQMALDHYEIITGIYIASVFEGIILASNDFIF